MRFRPPVYLAALLLILLGTAAWADQIILRDGTVYSGKFIRGDSKVVDFRVLGRVESFKTTDISQIVFKEPELDISASAPAKASIPAAAPAASPAPNRASVQPESSRAEETPQLQTTQRPAPAQAPQTAQATQTSSVTVPAGMAITVRTATVIDTDRNRVGDTFEAALEDDLISGTQVVAPRGSLVKGRIAYAKESGKIAGQSQLILELVDLTVRGKTYPIQTSDYTEVGSSRGERTAKTVGGTAALGAIIGAIAGGGKGAAIGAASGAAVGTGVQVITRGQVLRIPAETILEFKLQSPLTVDIS